MAILTYPEGNNLRGKGLTWMDRPVLSINNQVVQQIWTVRIKRPLSSRPHKGKKRKRQSHSKIFGCIYIYIYSQQKLETNRKKSDKKWTESIKHRWLRRHLGPKHWWFHDVASEPTSPTNRWAMWVRLSQLSQLSPLVGWWKKDGVLQKPL